MIVLYRFLRALNRAQLRLLYLFSKCRTVPIDFEKLSKIGNLLIKYVAIF